MSTRKATADNLETVINEILTDYAKEVVTDTKEAVEETGKMTAELTQTYAARIGRGQYAKSIKAKTTESTSFGTTVTIYSTKYRIAHLLEHGHILKVHGKIVGNTRGFPHFAPAEAKAESILEQKVKQVIGGR